MSDVEGKVGISMAGCSSEDKTWLVILLATFNGSNFLDEQIESIILQDYKNWDLYIRDDGSQDASRSIVNNRLSLDHRIHLLNDDKENLGVKNNFASLLQVVKKSAYGYIAFADQDDVWLPDKLSMLMDAMRAAERRLPGVPLLVHSDMEVVDMSLNVDAQSFMDYQGVMHEESALSVLLAQNFITGCTMLMNRKLLDIALPIPDEALMHDWWLALCAATFGYIGFIDKPLVKYRQHGDNAIGAKHIGQFLNPITGRWKERWLEGRDHLFQSMQQAKALAERIRRHDPDNPNLALVEAYATLPALSPFNRVKAIRHLGIRAQSSLRQTLLLSRLLLTPRFCSD